MKSAAILALMLAGQTPYAPPPTFSADDNLKNEAVGEICFVVKKSEPSNKASQVHFWTTDGTAKWPADYAPVNVILTFQPPEMTKSVCVRMVNDTVREPNETFTAWLSAVSNAKVTDPNAVGTIEDTTPPPGPPPSFYCVDIAILESKREVLVSCERTGANGKPSLIHYMTGGYYPPENPPTATEGVDYTAVAGDITVAATQVRFSFVVPIIDDALFEPAEKFPTAVTVADNGTVSHQATVTITDNDPAPPPPPVFTCQDVSVNEGAGQALIICEKTGGNGLASVVGFQTGGGMPTATMDADYHTVSGTITVAAGDDRFAFAVPIIDDAEVESAETFGTTIIGIENATVGHNAGVVIGDNDAPPPPPDKLTGGGYAKALTACAPWNPEYTDDNGSFGSRTPTAGEVFIVTPNGFGYGGPTPADQAREIVVVQPLTGETRALYLYRDCLVPVAAP